jgi:hypothetical protein
MDFSRRLLLCGGAPFALRTAGLTKQEELYRFRTAEVDIEMTIQFHDRYVSSGFWFAAQTSHRRFCLSDTGEEGRNCLFGSVARSPSRSIEYDRGQMTTRH